jgi:F0F1-type ATP synthase membrane subunit c/vacuolar-type H+-ATPase subunit K
LMRVVWQGGKLAGGVCLALAGPGEGAAGSALLEALAQPPCALLTDVRSR